MGMKPDELRKQLRRLGMTVPELAAELDVHESTVYRWLAANDSHRKMSAATERLIRMLEPKAKP